MIVIGRVFLIFLFWPANRFRMSWLITIGPKTSPQLKGQLEQQVVEIIIIIIPHTRYEMRCKRTNAYKYF